MEINSETIILLLKSYLPIINQYFIKMIETLHTFPSEVQLLSIPSIFFSKDFLFDYIFTTSPFGTLLEPFLILFNNFFNLFFIIVRILLLLAYFTFVLFLKLFVILLPYIINFLKIVYDFHIKNLSRNEMIIEASVLFFLTLIIIYKKKIIQLYKKFENYIEVKSKKVARVLPHIFYFILAISLTYISNKHLLINQKIMPIFTLVLPFITTLIRLYEFIFKDNFIMNEELQILLLDQKQIVRNINKKNLLEIDEVNFNNTKKSLEKYFAITVMTSRRLIILVIISVYYNLLYTLSLIPFINSFNIVYGTPYVKEFIVINFCWMMLNSKFSQIIYEVFILPFLEKVSIYLPTVNSLNISISNEEENFHSVLLEDDEEDIDIEEEEEEDKKKSFFKKIFPFGKKKKIVKKKKTYNNKINDQTNYFLLTLKRFKIINSTQLSVLQAISKDSIISIIAFVCLFVPYPFCNIGVIIIVFLIPAYRSLELIKILLVSTKIHEESLPKNLSKQYLFQQPKFSLDTTPLLSKSKIHILNLQQHWLRYWISFLVLLIFNYNLGNNFDGVLFGSRIIIILCLFLQHSYFKGSSWLIDSSLNTLKIMIDRNNKFQLEKELKRKELAEKENIQKEIDLQDLKELNELNSKIENSIDIQEDNLSQINNNNNNNIQNDDNNSEKIIVENDNKVIENE